VLQLTMVQIVVRKNVAEK